MAQQNINVTAVGDTLPVGGAKINANFAEVRAELVIAEAAATTAANVAAQASADAGTATAAVATATADAAAAVAAVAAATAASDAAVAAVAAATANNAVTDAKLRDSAGVSVIGRTTNSTGDPADIVAGSNDTMLRRVSDAVGFGQLTVGMVPNDLITYAKLQNISATSRILGRLTSGAGDAEELTGTQLTTLLDPVTSTLQGLAPPSGGGTATFLRADGIWSAPTAAASFAATSAETTAAVTITDTTKLSSPWLDLRRYGVDFTDSSAAATNNTAVLNALGAAAWPSHVTFYWPPGICRINDTVTFSDIHISHYFDNRASIEYYGAADRAAFVYGNTTSSQGSKFGLGGAGISISNRTTNPFTDEAFVGVQLVGTINNRTDYFSQVEGFTNGLQFRGPSPAGIAYSKFFLGNFLNNKYCLDFYGSDAGTFINENQFYGGSFRTSGMSNAIDSYGIRFHAAPGGYTGHNRNIFYKPSFELQNASGATNRTPVLYDNAGNSNEILGARVETGRGYVVDIVSTTVAIQGNSFDGVVIAGTWTARQRESDGGLAYNNAFTDLIDGRESQKPSWRSGDLVKKAFGTDTAKISVKGAFFQATGSTTATYTGTSKIGKDYLIIPAGATNALGWEFDTSYYKNLLLRKDFRSGFGGRTRIACYDGNGVQLTSADTGHPFAVANSALSYSSAYGGSYSSPTDQIGGPFFLSVGSACQKIRLFQTGGTNALHLRSVEIYALTNFDNPKPFRISATLAQSEEDWYVAGNPATILGGGFVARGQRVSSSAASSTTTAGYIATAEGWNASAWVLSTAYLIGQLVNNDTGKVYECLTAGTSAGSGGPTGTAVSGITDNTAVWGYIGTLVTWMALPVDAGDIPYDNGASGLTATDTQAAIDEIEALVGGSLTDVQVFPTSGTWTQVAGTPKLIRVICVGGGGGGGGGARVASGSACSGGGGGGGASYFDSTYLPASITSPVTVTVGAGGVGGAGATSNGVAGTDAALATSTTFGTYLTGWRGGLGAGGQLAANSGGGAGGGHWATGAGASGASGGSASTGGSNGGSGAVGATNGNIWGGSGGAGCVNASAGLAGGGVAGGASGGGSGGGIATTPVSLAGGASGKGPGSSGTAVAGGTAANPGAAGSTRIAIGFAGDGGGGGGSNAAGIGGAGGAGGNYGGGGGGGGSAVGANGGAGANGAGGICIVVTYF